MDSNQLIAIISEAFSTIPIPCEEKIAEHDYHLRGEDLIEFAGKRWQDIDIDFLCSHNLIQHGSSLCFMTPEAFMYYLPAYMKVSITDHKKAGLICDNIIWRLLLPDIEDIEREKQFFQKFDQSLEEHFEEETFIGQCLEDRNLPTAQEIEKDKQRFFGRMRLLSPEQSHAIKLFLEYMIEHHRDDYIDQSPQLALERYWKLF